MPKNDLEVGTTVVRKETGQIGKVVSLYYGNYIVELSDGEGFKHETRVVTQCEMSDQYKVHHKDAGFHITADEQEVYEAEKVNWTNALSNLMIESVASRSEIPLSPAAQSAMKDFAGRAAEDIAIQRSGEVFTNAVRNLAEANANTRFSPEEAANERAYQDLLKDVKGTPAEQQVTQMYEKRKQALEGRKQKHVESADRIKPTDYADPNYMERIAAAIWISTDIYPRLKQKIEQAATAAGVDPALVLEQPTNPDVEALKPTEQESQVLSKMDEHYNSQVPVLKQVAIRMKETLKDSEDIRALGSVLPPPIFARMVVNLNKAGTPAEILASVAHYTANVLSQPRTGAQTKHKRREPAGVPFKDEFSYKLEVEHPEYASISSIPEERQMLSYRNRFVTAVAGKDFKAAKEILADMRKAKDEYKTQYEDILSAAGPEVKSNERTNNAAREFEKSMEKMKALNDAWGPEAEKQIEVSKPKVSASTAGYGAGQPVRYRDSNAVHFIVSYDDNNPLKMYLIQEADVNSHDRTELIEASIDDVTPLKVYQIDVGDVVDAFGTIGRVTDASAKDLGFVYAELKDSHEIVPVDLSKTATPWQYAKPLSLCKCANDGGLITPGQEHNCPFIGKPMMAPKPAEERTAPIVAEEAKKPVDLTAALETLDVTIFPQEKPATEVYENESDPIEIGSTVKKFGSPLTGTVVGFKRNCCVVDWETGTSEACWKQELVLVTVMEDAN